MRITRTLRRGGRSENFCYIIRYWLISSILFCSGFTSQVAVARDAKRITSHASPLSINMTSNILQNVVLSYDSCLVAHPLLTKSITAFSLCSMGDLIAQKRDQTSTDIDWNRVCRFSLKGVGSSLIWNCWYESADNFVVDILRPFPSVNEVSAPVRIAIAMLIDQFVWAPLAFGSYDIPMATLLNGGSIKTVPSEVRTKLGGVLMSNALVWTPANIIIYTLPSMYRIGASNLVDILWQSMMADVAADCGNIQEVELKSKSMGVNIDADAQPVQCQ